MYPGFRTVQAIEEEQQVVEDTRNDRGFLVGRGVNSRSVSLFDEAEVGEEVVAGGNSLELSGGDV